MSNPSEIFYCRPELVLDEQLVCPANLVDQQLDPQLCYLMLNDEQHFIVMRRVAQWHLRLQQSVELKVRGIVVVA